MQREKKKNCPKKMTKEERNTSLTQKKHAEKKMQVERTV